MVYWEFITGFSLGFEYVPKEFMGEDSDGYYITIDLFIIRFVLEKE